eukprot:PITA_30822
MKLVDIDMSNGLFTWNNKRGGESQVASKLDRFIISEDLMLTGLYMTARILPFGGSDQCPVQLEASCIGFEGERNEQANKHQQEWEDLCKQEETFWRQKSRVQWLKEGDINTRFFHRSTLEHRSHNRISTIKDSRGNQVNTHKDIEVVLVQHFQGIVEEPLVDRSQFISDFTKHIPKLVTREDNPSRNKPMNEEKVSEVIKEM